LFTKGAGDSSRFVPLDRPGLQLSIAVAGSTRWETLPLFDNPPERL
jgi:hypothetical protein